VVDLLEKDGQGLNLTWEVRDGILNHSKTKVDILGQDWGEVHTLEGEVVKIADAVAYINHDIGDAIRAGVITENDLLPSEATVLGHSHSQRINTMVSDIIDYSWAARGDGATEHPIIGMSPQILEATNTLRGFLFDRVYNQRSAEGEAGKAREVIHRLYDYFTEHEDRLPPEYSAYSDESEQRVVDYIAGMTDQYASRLAEELSLIGGKTK